MAQRARAAGKAAAAVRAAGLKVASTPFVLCLSGHFSSALGPDLIINPVPVPLNTRVHTLLEERVM